MLLKIRYILVVVLFSGLVGTGYGFDTFKIKDIKLEGLQRISVGTVFNYLPVKVGDKMTTELSAKTIRSLYKTGFFKDVRLEN
ncbi:MAG: outer membrane protein assembly factor BamA, partial [Gammaproteobacteria bacterium]|nr:outer membrane protein assembly factor BamA [Gammaproteobacteria bacterium]